jgi:hypothetical protein
MSYFFEPYATITWLDDIKAIHIKWENLYLVLEKFQEICIKAMSVLSKKGGHIWIADLYDSEGVFNAQIKSIISGDLHIMAQQAGITMVLTIMPKEVGLSSLNTKSWIREVTKKEGIEIVQFDTLDRCKTWILNHE